VNALLPDISVSIVSYNTRDLLKTCLASLAARQAEGEVRLEIIVADNGSKDDSVSMVRDHFSEVRIIKTPGNIGYGRANNLALAEACGRYFLVLNSDTEIEPGALRTMADYLDSNRDCDIVGPRLILPDGATQPSCFGRPTLAAVFWEQTYLHQLLPGNRITGGFEMTYWDHNTQREVMALCGAAMLIRRERFEQAGGFDPHYFMYFEDIDLCLRFRALGSKAAFLPTAVIRHNLGASSRVDWRKRAEMIAAYNQSRYYYFTKTYGLQQGQQLKTIVLLGAGLRLVLWSFLALLRPAARTQVRLFWNVWHRTWAMRPLEMEF
jgi:GT2 family glycosyltransferase